MDKVTLIEIESFGQIETHAIIEHKKGEFTSMSKATYDEMLTANDTNEL
jgi:hypothetical protein